MQVLDDIELQISVDIQLNKGVLSFSGFSWLNIINSQTSGMLCNELCNYCNLQMFVKLSNAHNTFFVCAFQSDFDQLDRLCCLLRLKFSHIYPSYHK